MSVEGRKLWRLSYAPASDNPGVREYVYEGTREQLDHFFASKVMCLHCRTEFEEGATYQYTEPDGTVIETHHKPESPWATGCGCEWDLEEVAP